MKKWSIQISFTILLLTIGFLAGKIWMFSSEPSNDLTHKQQFLEHYKIFTLVPQTQLDFCEENVPLHISDVSEKLDKELLINTYWQSHTLLYLKRTHRYFPIIEPILKKNNIPDDFKYLALIESGLENVVSPAGASGFWQIMKETGKEKGLEINKEVDERYHLEKSTEFACKYLREAYDKFGSWTMAAASYNMGLNGTEEAITKQQVNNYYDLLLNEETARYIYRILAVKKILETPEDYGFKFREIDLYSPYKTTSKNIRTPIYNLVQFAQENNTTYKILKILNPWLMGNKLSNPKLKNYTIKFPSPIEKGLVPYQSYTPEQIQGK